jgi:3-dehydroquinate synthase
MNSEKLTVNLGDDRSYPIFIGSNIRHDLDKYSPYISGKQVCIITNETIAEFYLSTLIDTLSTKYQVDSVILPDGEKYKNLETLNKIFDELLVRKHNRTTTLIALGGGVVGDMTGFAAACYQRGVDFIQVPTTLLSQVDSSVGGKTGVNHPAGKNMIGAFHQPKSVVIDIDVLNTLPARELSAGIAEVVKYGLIGDAEFYQWLESNITGLQELDFAVMTHVVARSCQNKADVVAQDEKEGGIRAILNLGHTFGHAIEAAQSYSEWLHGEAVAAGMVVALELSSRMDWIEKKEVVRLKNFLVAMNLPVGIPKNISIEEMLDNMAVDKKVLNGKLRLVLLKAIGSAVVTDAIPLDKVKEAIYASYI